MFFIPILWHNQLLFRICVFVLKQCNFSLAQWFTATKDVSFVTVVHCNLGIFLLNSGSPRQRNFLSSQWLTVTKEFSFVAVVHSNKGIFLRCSGSPWHMNFQQYWNKKIYISEKKGIYATYCGKYPEKYVSLKKIPALKKLVSCAFVLKLAYHKGWYKGCTKVFKKKKYIYIQNLTFLRHYKNMFKKNGDKSKYSILYTDMQFVTDAQILSM